MVRPLYTALALLSLCACAPATVCIDDTAFAATVTSPALTQAQTFMVQPERSVSGGRALSVSAPGEVRIVSDEGAALALDDLTLGTRVYIRGSLEGTKVTATEVRLLNQ